VGIGIVALLQQADPAVLAQLERIGSSLVILTIAGVVLGTFSLGALVFSMWTMRSASKLLGSVESEWKKMAPRAEPLIEKATRIADDARDVTDSVRRGVTDLMDTVADVNAKLKQASRSVQLRLREFGAVLEVVQEEAEEILLDAASTARGIHATAEALRAPRRQGLPAETELEEDQVEFDLDEDVDIEDEAEAEVEYHGR
jgi:uncharacterized protein YoxC